MTNNTEIFNDAVQNMLMQIQQGNNISSAQILQTAMNLLMVVERNLHLQNSAQDKANGFF